VNIFTYCAKLVDLTSKRVKSAEALVKQGDWLFFGIGNYTAAEPLVVNAAATSKLSFTAEDITYTTGEGIDFNYDYVNQKFLPTTLGDVFMVECRFKAKCSTQNGHGVLKLESPTTSINPIQAQSISIPLAQNSEQFISVSVPLFIGQEVLDNGLEVKWTSTTGNFSLYDVSFMVVRLASGKA